MSENNPYGTNPANSQDPYSGYRDPAAQYSAQSQYGGSNPASPLQSQPQAAYGQSNPAGGGQNPFASEPQNPTNAAYYQQPNPFAQAEKDAQTSWIVALVGLILGFGIITGPIAIYLASKAERGGARATVGKVLGWISVGLFIAGALGIILFFTLIFSASY